jgi:hypothetical protein
VQTSCVMLALVVEAPAKRRPFCPSSRQSWAAFQPFERTWGVALAFEVVKIMRAWAPPQILELSPEQAGADEQEERVSR